MKTNTITIIAYVALTGRKYTIPDGHETWRRSICEHHEDVQHAWCGPEKEECSRFASLGTCRLFPPKNGQAGMSDRAFHHIQRY
jgi:hypothetical protein